ncbi:hypothetical protein [Rhabdothermincola salaria]|uniref:hypothetical protein n=1 Tax=Rhabdothermincola salaria TaxID=2903142 RepID=UPI001E4811E2|nr:hypothetical protein [Rhabdothermincola salaria]MCD9623130.1 hypothetical protein [Rhabdothermincola salaria]
MPTSALHAPSGPTPPPPGTAGRRLRGRVLVGALVVLGALGACSSEPEGPPPAEAADVVAGGFGLGTDVRQCLLGRFEDDPSSSVALSIGGAASLDDRRALQDVLEGCITPEALAEVIAAGAGAGVPGTDGERQACLEREVLALDQERRSLLLVGLALSGDGTPDQLDVDLGAVTSELFAACDVAFDTDPGDTDPGDTDPSDTTTAPGSTSAP